MEPGKKNLDLLRLGQGDVFFLTACFRCCESHTRPSEVCHELQMTGKTSEHIFTALKQTFGEIYAVSGTKTKMGQIFYPSGACSERRILAFEISWPKFI